MNLKKRLAVLSAAALLTAALAVPASAHHNGWGGNGCGVVAAANVLGETAQSVVEQARASGTCVGAVVAQMGKVEEFKAEKLRLKQEQLQTQVENGQRTQEDADDILARMEERQQNCDGTGYGNCDGSYHGNGVCDGTCVNDGVCDGSYHDSGICDGTCVNGSGNGVCDGSGQGWGNGQGQGNGQGHGGRHGGGRGCGRWS